MLKTQRNKLIKISCENSTSTTCTEISVKDLCITSDIDVKTTRHHRQAIAAQTFGLYHSFQ
ncbi:Hypothetical protein PAU_00334 [Photorhabdus asymbiotica]|uniref:Uncharacterized protein n=1 Tax=Photorhabdus asymbiotica subsp. asymbiotica (strain ATCC 43949 / 3105-77) TaxID=553480 RepID=C7BI69_PHOAA|nr:Hypothetical protein PAU_00334 [Photorhabdus asymbiotica]